MADRSVTLVVCGAPLADPPAVLRAAGVRVVDVQTGRLGEVPTNSGANAELVQRFDPAWLVTQLNAATAA
jgi:hypothetical protein